MAENDLTKIFSDVVKKWRMVESQRAIFGMDMPQTARAVSAFLANLEEVFARVVGYV